MIDEDRETKYYNEDNVLEWRYKYYTTKYALNGGTHAITVHLTTGTKQVLGHGLEAESLRLERAKNQQATIQAAMVQATEHPKKCRRIGDSSRESLNPNIIEVLYK